MTPKPEPSNTRERRLIRPVGILIAACAIVVTAAAPAWADPAVPTNYRSVVLSVDPEPAGVEFAVLGGDAFMEVTAAPGSTVDVPGYFGEPYLRIDATGRVWLNLRSPARYINTDRYGNVSIPGDVDVEADPVWQQIGTGGSFAWHDHRTHWMSPDLPPTIAGDRTEVVFPWSFTVTVNGNATKITGELVWIPSNAPTIPVLLGIGGILPLLFYRRGRHSPVAATAVVGAGIALVVSVAQYAATPGFDRGTPVDAVIPAIGLTAGLAALTLLRSDIRRWGAITLSGIAAAWWAITAAAALTAPVLPSALPEAVERASVAVVMWAGAGATLIAAFEATRGGTAQGRSAA